jgi:tRNA(adenine34) deaminase
VIARLPEHWRSAFRQAWAAYVAGTIAVGAVVVDPYGVIAADARNRVFAGDPPRHQLAGSWLAHAELNAIAQIDAERLRGCVPEWPR